VICAVVLAAGSSTRFGRTKQLVEVGGKPLAQHVIDAATSSGVDDVVLVLGHDADPIRTALRLPSRARIVVNERHALGQATSLAAGLDAVPAEDEGAVVLLADQPGIAPEDVRALIDAFLAHRSRIVRLRYADGPGPALLSRQVFPEATRLVGDAGARELIAAHPDWVQEVVRDAPTPPDIDTPEDLDELRHS
jgi:molybdenum cofactor cytidylyltransferase